MDDNIVVRGLSFSYPTRKTVPILTDLSFEVAPPLPLPPPFWPGEEGTDGGHRGTIWLWKVHCPAAPTGVLSYTAQYTTSFLKNHVQRFYDPDLGYIELDGKNIKVSYEGAGLSYV